MKFKLLVFVICLLISTPAYAGYFIFHSGETITGKASSCGARCSNDPNAIRVDQSTYDSASSSTHKVVGKSVISKSRAELDAEEAARNQAAIDAEIARINALQVTIEEAVMALVDAINLRVLPVVPITIDEIVQKIKDEKGL